jgi:hypothetical protein
MQNFGLVDWVMVIGRAAVSGQGGPCAGFSHTPPSSNRYLPRRSAQSLTHHNLTPPASQCCGHFCIDIPATASLLYPHHCKQAVRKQHHLSSALPSCGSATHPIHNSARSSQTPLELSVIRPPLATTPRTPAHTRKLSLPGKLQLTSSASRRPTRLLPC